MKGRMPKFIPDNTGRKRPDMIGNKLWVKSSGMTGKTHSKVARNKMSKSGKGKHGGIRNYFWKGGISSMPGYRAVMEQNRKARQRENGGAHTVGEWENLKAQYNWTCPACKRSETEIVLTIDHIIPIVKGGSNNIENIQPLCISCNSKKSTKIIKYEPD